MRQTPAKGVARLCRRKLSGRKKVLGNWTRQVLCDKTNRRRQQAKPFLLSGVPEDVSVLTNGHNEVLRHFQRSHHCARDQRLGLETPQWRVLDFHGNQLSVVELERQSGKIKKGPLVFRDCEHSFAEDLIAHRVGVVAPQLPVLTKVSCLVEAMKMGGSYELVEKLWAQFVLTAGRVNTQLDWSRDEVVLGSVNFRSHLVSFQSYIVVLLLVNSFNRNAAPNSVTSGWWA